MFGFNMIDSKITPGGNDEPRPSEITWEEFPWKKYLIDEDIIKKWSAVDMKYILYLHSNFDIE